MGRFLEAIVRLAQGRGRSESSLAAGEERVFDANSIEPNGVSVRIGATDILYRDIIEAILNLDTIPGDGVGGSIILKTLQRDNVYAQNYRVKRYVFAEDEAAISRVREVFEAAVSNSAATMKTSVREDIFRRSYFAEPVVR